MYTFGNENNPLDNNLIKNLKYCIIDKIHKLSEEDLYYLHAIIDSTTRTNENNYI